MILRLSSLLLASFAIAASAQQSITTARVAVTQNFDSIGSAASAAYPTGWRRGEVWTSGDPAVTEVAGTSGTGVITGSSNGGAYNWASGVNATSTDRAVGFLSSAGVFGWPSPNYLGYAFTNNTGATIHSLDLSWAYEKYRSGSRAFTWTFEHGSNAAALTAATAGDQSYAADANNTTVSNPPASVSKSVTLSGLSIAPGATYYLRWTYTGVGGSNNAQGLAVDNFSLTAIAPVLGAPDAPSAFSASYLSPSAAQTLSLTGSDLSGAVTVTAPANFEVSTDGSSYAASVSVASVPATVSVRLAATAPIGAASGNLTLASDGAVGRTVALAGTVVPPVITPSVTTLSGFTSDYGSASTAQTLTVAVSNPVGPVTVTAPSGYEVSVSGSAYASTASLAAASLPATLSVRVAATAAGGAVSGNLTFASNGATTQSVALSGTVRGVLTLSVASLSGFQAVEGGVSTAQTFTLNGGGLTGALDISVPAGYEVSVNGGAFGSTVAFASQVTTIVSSSSAFAVLKADGSVVTWGAASNGGDSSAVAGQLSSGVTSIQTNGWAFAALKSDGSVVTWGYAPNGGSSSSVAGQLTSGVTKVHALRYGFAASKIDGSTVFWGSHFNLWNNMPIASFATGSTAVTSICWSLHNGYAALKSDGSVVTWIDPDFVDPSYTAAANTLTSGVVEIVPYDHGFVARKSNGSVVLLGSGNSTNPFGSGTFTDLCGGVGAIAGLQSDGSVVVYRYNSSGADPASVASQLSSGVTALYTTGEAFAALKSNGEVIAWGDATLGGSTYNVANMLSGGVTSIVSSNSAFAALKSGGGVVAWGSAAHGGSQPNLFSGVTALYANDNGFAALKSDGSVFAWGEGGWPNVNYDYASVASRLSSGVTAIYPGAETFAAVKSDGSLVTWGGTGLTGADSSAVAAQFAGFTLPLTLQVRLAAGATAGPVAGNLTISSAGVDTQTLSLSGSILPPASITPSVTSLTGFTADAGTASSAQTLTVSGAGLSGAVTVTPSANFEVSYVGGAYAASASLPAASLPATVSVRLAATASSGAVTGNLTLTSAGADAKTVSLSGTVAAWIEPSVTALSSFTADVGTASTAQTVTVSGAGLSGPVTVTAPSGYEISADGSSYARTLNLGSGVLRIASANQAFAALKTNGSVITWGWEGSGGDSTAVAGQLASGVTGLFSTRQAFAALKADGSVVTWGKSDTGGNSTAVASQLASGVATIYSNNSAFAALKTDGSVVTWGWPSSGGDSTSVASQLASGVRAIGSTGEGFAALKGDGSVVTWGSTGGNSTSVASQLASGVTRIYSNSSAFAALKTDGSVVTWGGVTAGGDSTSVASQLVSGVRTIYSNSSAFAALKAGGSVVTWGESHSGGAGSVFDSYYDDSTEQSIDTYTPVTDRLASGVTTVCSTLQAFAALKADGSVVTWGDGTAGGNSTSVASQLASGVTAIGSTYYAFAALKTDGSVVTWGGEYAGGNSASVASHLGSGVTAIYSNPHAFAALKSDGSVVTWGHAYNGGDSTPVADQLASGVVGIYSNPSAFVALKADGSVVTWGAPLSGGDSTAVAADLAPGAPVLPLTLHVRLAADTPAGSVSGDLTLASTNATTRTVALSGTTLLDVTVNYTSAAHVPLSLSSPAIPPGSTATLSLGYAPATGTELMVMNNTGMGFIQGTFDNLTQGQNVALTYSGQTYEFVVNYYGGNGNDLVLVWKNSRLLAWGVNSFGQLGNGKVTNSNVPVAVNASGLLAGKTVVSVTAGSSHNLALCADGTVAAWGYNAIGQLGNGSTIESHVPVAVLANGALVGKTVVAVSCGSSHSLALCSDGTVVAWGDNTYGQLGNGSTTNSNLPVAVSTSGVLAGKAVVALSTSLSSSLALCSDGTLVAWGANSFGQLGDGSTTSRSVPVAVNTSGVLAGKTTVAVWSAGSHSMALCSDGKVVAWGLNGSGQLGNGGTTMSRVPVLVDTSGVLVGKTAVAISGGNGHSLALCSDGTVAAWGKNAFGQLGDGSTTSSSVPVAVNASGLLAGKTVVSIKAGSSHSVTLCSDGTVVSWGNNAIGQLGDGSTTSSSLPIAVSTGTLAQGERFIEVSDGTASHTLALVAAPPVTLVVPHTHQEEWRNTHFGTYMSEANAADSADPDGDGLNNLLEYALGQDPNTSGVKPAALALNGANLDYTYTRSTSAKDNGVTYQIEWSDTLEAGSWSTLNVTEQIQGTLGALETVKASVPKGTTGKRFLRLRITGVAADT